MGRVAVAWPACWFSEIPIDTLAGSSRRSGSNGRSRAATGRHQLSLYRAHPNRITPSRSAKSV
jgi:hypothetical protein